MLCQSLNAEFSKDGIHVAHVIIDGAVDAPDTLGKMLGPDLFEKFKKQNDWKMFVLIGVSCNKCLFFKQVVFSCPMKTGGFAPPPLLLVLLGRCSVSDLAQGENVVGCSACRIWRAEMQSSKDMRSRFCAWLLMLSPVRLADPIGAQPVLQHALDAECQLPQHLHRIRARSRVVT